MLKIISLVVWLTCLMIFIECHSSSSEISSEIYSEDLRYVFKKYANAGNEMNSNQLVRFVNQFRAILEQQTNNSMCFSLKLNELLNQTKSLKNDTIINMSRFYKLSSYLVSFIDNCFDDLSQNALNRTVSHNHHDHEHSDHASNWNVFLENISKISKESMLHDYIVKAIENEI